MSDAKSCIQDTEKTANGINANKIQPHGCKAGSEHKNFYCSSPGGQVSDSMSIILKLQQQVILFGPPCNLQFVCVCVHVCVSVCVHVYICMYAYVYLCIYVLLCMYVYIYIMCIYTFIFLVNCIFQECILYICIYSYT